MFLISSRVCLVSQATEAKTVRRGKNKENIKDEPLSFQQGQRF